MQKTYGIQRRNKKLTAYQVRKLMNVDRITYAELERGDRALNGEQLEQWSNIMANAKELRKEHEFKMLTVNQWYKDGKLLEIMKKFKYNKTQLAQKTGFSYITVCRLIKNDERILDDTKEEIYDFFQKEINNNSYLSEPKIDHRRKENKVNVETETMATIEEPITEENPVIEESPVVAKNETTVTEKDETTVTEKDEIVTETDVTEKDETVTESEIAKLRVENKALKDILVRYNDLIARL